jgi:hypothetical protein
MKCPVDLMAVNKMQDEGILYCERLRRGKEYKMLCHVVIIIP